MILRNEATLHRTALLLGLTTGVEVVAWADARLHTEDEPPHALIELSLTGPSDLSALRIALEPLAIEPVPPDVVHEMLLRAARDLAAGRRNVHDTVHLLRQMRGMLPLSVELDAELDHLTDAHMLAQVGIGPSVEEVESTIRHWLDVRPSASP